METYTVRKTVSVCCAHRLPGHPTCDKLHGHNFTITMQVTATTLKRPHNFVIDFGELKSIAKQWDHSGDICESSAEMIASQIGAEILGHLKPLEIVVAVEETPGSQAIWRWTPDDNLTTG